MKHNNRHITILPFLIWRFFILFFNKIEKAAKQQILTLFTFFLFATSFAQQYTNYSTKEGLPSNHVYTIVQDAKGFMWFLTDKGMVKYNGKTFKVFTTKNGLPINDVWDAFPTSDGKIWYMSKTSKLGYVQKDTVFSFPNKNKEEIINPIYSSQVGDSIFPTGSNKIFTLKNNQWISKLTKPDTIFKLDRTIIKHKEVSTFILDESEMLKLYNHSFKKIKSIKTSNIYGRNGVRGQLNDSLFFWTTDNNYSILNLNSKKLKSFDLKEVIGIDEVKHLRINVVNNKLQISGNGFVAKLDDNYEVIHSFFFPKDIAAHFGFIDNLNSIWLATFNNGVYKLPYVKKTIKYELLNNKIQSFDIVNNKLIVGVYEKGFYTYNQKEQTFQVQIKSNDYIYGVTPIASLNTNMYSTYNKLIKETNGVKSEIDFNQKNSYGFNTNELGRKFLYYQEKIYGNFAFGINKLNPNTLKIEKEFNQKGVNDIITFKNRLLVATTNGLSEIKKDSLVPVIFKSEKFNKSILTIKIIDDTHILINTDGFGSYISDLQTIQPLHLTDFLIVEEAFIEKNALWLATNSGVLKFNKKDTIYQFEKRFTITDGLPTNHINTIHVDAISLLVGTNNGIAILPKNQESIPQLLDVYIEEATYNKQKITTESSIFKYIENNNIKFTIATIDFSSKDEEFIYNYKLEPIHKDWRQTTSNNFSFNNLKPGNYTLFIKANTIEKELHFEIQPLWWQTIWFKTLIAILSILLVVYVTRYFSKQLEFKKNQKIFEDKRLSELQLKALRSQMNPHFVFNSLSAIQYYIGENNFEASETYLVKFSKLIRQFFELSKENEISLATEVSLLNNYLEIEKLRFKEKLNFTIQVDPNLNMESTMIPTMLLQPIVENAVNHGVFNKMENGLVVLHFIFIDSKTFKVEIIDDGVGFVNTKKRQNKNVKSSNVLKDRLHFLNYSLKWNINYKEEEVYPNKTDKGNKSVFIIKKTK